MRTPSEKISTGLTLMVEGIAEAVTQICNSIVSMVSNVSLHKSWEVAALTSNNPIVIKRYKIYLRTNKSRIKKKQRDMIIRILKR